MDKISDKPPPSPFIDLYKVSIQIDQNKRRLELLQEQKRRRETLQDAGRGLEEGFKIINDDNHGVKRKYIKEYNHKIMLSEWLIEVPEDLDVSWFMKVCPQGHRCLVVAEKHTTKCYSKSGRFECKFKSVLPGAIYNCGKFKTTILDCIFCEKTNTFYVLDALVWSNQDLTNCEAEFRFFWLQSKFTEYPEIELPSESNKYSFKYVPHIRCDFFLIKQNLETIPYFNNDLPKVDGILFYHKEASYSPGATPLVGWLKPFMIPEKLKIPVAEEYLKKRPENYVDMAQFIARRPKKKQKLTQNIIEEMEEG